MFVCAHIFFVLGDWGIGEIGGLEGLGDWGIKGFEDWGIWGLRDWGIGGLKDLGIGGLGN